MWWRLTSRQFQEQVGRANKLALRKIVNSGESPGILAYVNGQPAGWCSLGPREEFGRLERSPVLKRIDNLPVWSLVCYYVDRLYRRQGLMEKLTLAAIDFAEGKGARIVEAYPVEMTGHFKPAEAYTGVARVLRELGFAEVLRRTPDRPIMRYYL
jgi:GNAT superfamily N-acetyltransferase